MAINTQASWYAPWQEEYLRSLGISKFDLGENQSAWGQQFGSGEDSWRNYYGQGEGSLGDLPDVAAPSQDWLNNYYANAAPGGLQFASTPGGAARLVQMGVPQSLIDQITENQRWIDANPAQRMGDESYNRTLQQQQLLLQVENIINPNRGYDSGLFSKVFGSPLAPLALATAGATGLLGTGASTFGEVAAGGAMDMMGSAGVGSSLGGGATASAAELGAGSALASGAGATAMASEPIAAASPLAAPTATPMVAPEVASFGAAPVAGAPEVASFGAAPVAGAPEVIGSQLGATSLGTGLTTVSPEFVAASGAAGGLGTAAGTGLATSLIGAGLGTATGGGGIIESLLSDPKKLAQIGGGAWQIYEGLRAEGKIDEANAYLKQAFERSDPFAPARAGAMDQYMQWQKDPMSYMSSPLAQMQIDQMNRAARAKQASLGQTWNIGADGGIQGSGIGAVDFARELQTNLAKQYETALGNRAQQAGMNLFPNMQALGQMGSMIGQGVDATQQTGAGAGNVLGGLWGVFGDDIKKGVFGA